MKINESIYACVDVLIRTSRNMFFRENGFLNGNFTGYGKPVWTNVGATSEYGPFRARSGPNGANPRKYLQEKTIQTAANIPKNFKKNCARTQSSSASAMPASHIKLFGTRF